MQRFPTATEASEVLRTQSVSWHREGSTRSKMVQAEGTDAL